MTNSIWLPWGQSFRELHNWSTIHHCSRVTGALSSTCPEKQCPDWPHLPCTLWYPTRRAQPRKGGLAGWPHRERIGEVPGPKFKQKCWCSGGEAASEPSFLMICALALRPQTPLPKWPMSRYPLKKCFFSL